MLGSVRLTDSAFMCHFQHGKTLLASVYFSAWILLLCPWKRIILCSHSERYSGTIGSQVRDVLDRFGPLLGILLKQDSKAKNEWNIDSHGGFDGGMVCKGYKGDINGRAADILLFDDILKNSEQALSAVILDAQWDFYSTVAFSRLGPDAPIVFVTTRWVAGDLPGRVYKQARETGEKWKVINFKAIAEGDDPLGRKPGEALWPTRVPLKRLEQIKKVNNRWFRACWQQDPPDQHGMHFRPRRSTTPPESPGWPTYRDTGDAWSLPVGTMRRHIRHVECVVIIGVDWNVGKKAISPKRHSDYAAFVVSCLTPDKDVLILEVVNERLLSEQHGPRLAEVCRTYQRLGCPILVASDDDMIAETSVENLRRYRDIPEIRRLPIAGHNKLVRAQSAINLAGDGKIWLPPTEPEKPAWLDEYLDQLTAFTGIADEHDDMVDATGIVGRMVDLVSGDREEYQGDYMLVAGKQVW